MITVEVNQRAGKKIPVTFWHRRAKKISRGLGLRRQCRVSLAIVGPVVMQHLNKTYRGKNQPTNVLSFSEAEVVDRSARLATSDLGEVVICYQQAVAEANQLGRTVAQQLEFLFIHGVLHLLGYDHQTKRQATVMERLEQKVINQA